MKRTWDIKRCWLLLWCLMVAAPTFASVIPTPRDPATIEALISLHKLIKGEEDKALTKVTTSFGEQSIITKGATKFNDVRTTLDSKLNNAYSYIILVGALGSTANSMYRLIQEYSQFTRSTFQIPSRSRWWRGTIPRRTWRVQGKSRTSKPFMPRLPPTASM